MRFGAGPMPMPVPQPTRPVIGITTERSRARWAQWDQDAYLLTTGYADLVAQAGGNAILLPPGCGSPTEILRIVDGLLLTGGPDIDPRHYGQPAHDETVPGWAVRDSWEIELARSADELDLATLGVCRGLQVINVARGGTLLQHLPDIYGQTHRPDPAGFGPHRVWTAPGSRLRDVLGPTCDMAAHHHQAVATPGRGVVVTAWTDDGCVEGIELDDRTWVCGIQGHPESTGSLEPFSAFVEAARSLHVPVV